LKVLYYKTSSWPIRWSIYSSRQASTSSGLYSGWDEK
jgi:hypothetical protein